MAPLDWRVRRAAAAGTQGGQAPFWSPDGRSIGFFSFTEIRTVDLTGGSPQTVCPVALGLGGTWNEDDVIVFGQLSGELSRVSAQGGKPMPLIVPEASGELNYGWPEFLPDGDHFLFLIASTAGRLGDAGIGIGSLATGDSSICGGPSTKTTRSPPPPHELSRNGQPQSACRVANQRLARTRSPRRSAGAILCIRWSG